jgi:hypothetical protein
LAHFTLAGNTQDIQTVKQLVLAVEQRFGQSDRSRRQSRRDRAHRKAWKGERIRVLAFVPCRDEETHRATRVGERKYPLLNDRGS